MPKRQKWLVLASLIAVLVVIGVIMGVRALHQAERLGSSSVGSIPRDRPDDDEYCFDFTGTLPDHIVFRINQYYARELKKNLDIDCVIVIMPTLGGRDIDEYAAQMFTDWKIGKSTQGKKGILIFIAKKEQQIKIEVGYDLEHIYTDGYLGQVEQELLKEFFEQAIWDIGFLSLIENFMARAERMAEKGDDVREVVSGDRGEYYSGGAGARTVFDFGAALKKPIPKLGKEMREYFGPQPTPELAYQRYMEYCAHIIPDREIDLFSDLTKEFYRNWPRSTTGQMRAEAETFDGLQVLVKQEGKYAVVMVEHGDDINKIIGKNPYFFIKTGRGWQVDLGVMAHSIMMFNATGGWHFIEMHHPYMFAFKDFVMKTNRYYPYKGQKAFLGLNYYNWNDRYGGFEIHPEYRGPAEKAGVASKDILIAIDGIKITKPYQDWWELMHNYEPGDTVILEVVRDGKGKKIPVMLGKAVPFRDEYLYGRKQGDPWLGFYFASCVPYERAATGEWVYYVVEVIPRSPADRAGMRTGDLLYDVYDECIPAFREGRIKPGDRVVFQTMRDLKTKMNIPITVGEWGPGSEGL